MAQMYPEIFPGCHDPENPEFICYQSFRKLSDHYHVFYSKRLRGVLGGRAESEIDFIVSNGTDAVLCFEAKGGILAYAGSSGVWTQNSKPMDVAPDVQAQSACHTLMKLLPKELSMANVDWALIFPQCCLSSSAMSISLDPVQIVDEQGLIDIGSAVRSLEERAKSRFRKRGFTPAEHQRFVDVLTRSMGFVQKLGVRIAREEQQLIQVTEEQCGVLEDLEINQRMIVHGYAGTGKTILAQTFAKRLATRGQKVLLLFYNKGIASAVRFAFEKRGHVQVSTFSSLAKRLVQEEDPQWWDETPRRGDDFWRLELPSRLLDIAEDQLPKFDAVIVDEGQDFKPEWFEFLQRLLLTQAETHFAVFLDEHQDIFKHWTHFPCSPRPARKVLQKNCRNTRRIIDYLNGSYPTTMVPFEGSPVGTSVIVHETKGRVHEQSQIVATVKQLTGVEGVSPGSIVILLNQDKSESSLADVKSIAGYPLLSTYERYDPRSRSIYYSQISIFKGLEADVVFLILPSGLTDSEFANAVYVQGSRARHALHVFKALS